MLAVPTRPQPRLAAFVAAHGIRTCDLAEVVGVHPRYLGGVIHGRFRPSRRLASSIADALDVPVAYLWPSDES